MTLRREISLILIFFLAVAASGCLPEEKTRTTDKTDSMKPSKFDISIVGEKLLVTCNGVDLVSYQKEPMSNPVGGDKFKASDFIHPLKTPSGFTVTDAQPDDHLHHFGLWWPWKYLKVDGRQILFWELQRGEGIVEAQDIITYKTGKDQAGFTSISHYVDRTAPEGPKVILNEKVAVNVSGAVQSPASGYYLDMAITHRCATKNPVEVVLYRYSGFAIRAAAGWKQDNSIMLTSQGIGRTGSNFTRADWVRVQGDAENGNKAGFIMMSSPENRDAPQLLRTWDTPKSLGIFINFNPVQEKPWYFEPGKEYTQKYRLFIYDGTVNAEQAQKIWLEYSTLFKKK